MSIKKNLLLQLFIAIFMASSCEDGVLSTKDMLTQSWVLTETTINGNENYTESLFYKSNIYTFFQDEKLQIVITQNQGIINGTWFLNEDGLVLTIALSGVMYDYKIVKLDSTNLWLSIETDSGLYLYKFFKIPDE